MIELAPLPTPPAPPVAVPPPPPPPEPQVQPKEEPVPVAKPLLQSKPKPVVRHVEPPRPQPPQVQPTVEPAAPAPPQPAVAAPPAPVVDDLQRFSALIAAQLERYKRYPAMAQRRGEQGVVKLRFTLSRSGGVLNAQIEHGSGYADLDNEVLALVQRAQPLPPIPANIPDNTLDIHVPVAFGLH
jgi:protein TonB